MSLTVEAMFEKSEMTSCLSVDPTATAVEMQLGEMIASVKPLLPIPATVATPALRKLSMLGLTGLVSQALVNLPPPRLKLTEASLTPFAYFDRNGDVLRNADAVIIEFMQGGLSGPTPWPGYNFCPNSRPWFRTAQILLRAWLSGAAFFTSRNSGALPVQGLPDEHQLGRFKAMASSIAKESKLVIFFYPVVANLRDRPAWQRVCARHGNLPAYRGKVHRFRAGFRLE
jgi:hypothetical protein